MCATLSGRTPAPLPGRADWPRQPGPAGGLEMGEGCGGKAWGARAPGNEGPGAELTFLGRLHGASGGRRGPQSFSAPADCGRRAEWKLGRDWKAGTWHPRGGGGEQQEEERELARRAAPGRLPSRTSSSPTRAGPGSAPRAVGRWHAGGVHAWQTCLRPGLAASSEVCAAPGSRFPAARIRAATLPPS